MIVAYLQKGSAPKEQGRSAECMSRIHHNEMAWFQAAVRRKSELLAPMRKESRRSS